MKEKRIEAVVVPHVSLSPTRLVLFNTYEGFRSAKRSLCPPAYASKYQINAAGEIVENAPGTKDGQRWNTQAKGIVSKAAAKEIRNRIDWFLHLCPTRSYYCGIRKKSFQFKLTFVTLTLSSKQLHSDNEIKEQLLNQFLIESKKKWKVRNYLWRAEPQKNGNIHFHIIFDQYIRHDSLRVTWNRIQEKLGYISAFAATNGHSNPNSTDIHGVKNIRKLGAYFAKYLSQDPAEKAEEKGWEQPPRPIDGKLWGCSIGLSNIKKTTTEEGRKTSRFTDAITYQLGAELNFILDKFKKRTIVLEHATVIMVRFTDWEKLKVPNLLSMFVNGVNDWRAKYYICSN